MRFFVLLICLISCTCCFGQHAGGSADSGARLAYVNLDTLEAKYTLLKMKQAEFTRRKEKMEEELKSAYKEIQKETDAAEKKQLSKADYEQAQERVAKMQQALEIRKQELTDQLTAAQETINNDMKVHLDAFLKEYNKVHHYDCILSYSWGGASVLYVDKKLDITAAVVNGMNAAAKNEVNKKNK